MFNAEEIESWNEIFVNGQIQESDLKHPTEGFLVRALVAYLQKFGYKVEPPENVADNSREKRLFLVRLAHNINRMLKITDKSYAFFYYDLIKPVPKKTSHTLDILLNYYYYYNMFKNEVFEMANGRIMEREELLNRIQATQQDNQERKQRAEQIGEEIATISKAVPIIKAQLDAMMVKIADQQENIQKEHDAVEELNKKLTDLRTQERNLKKQMVEDNEAIKIKSELNDLQTNINEHLLTKKNLEIALNDRMEILKNLESLFKLLQEAKIILPPNVLDEYKELTKKLKQLKSEYETLSHKNEALQEIITKQESELQSLREKFKHKKQQFEQEKAKKCTSVKELESSLSLKQQEASSLKSQLYSINNQLEEHMQTRISLEIAINKIMSNYKKKEG